MIIAALSKALPIKNSMIHSWCKRVGLQLSNGITNAQYRTYKEYVEAYTRPNITRSKKSSLRSGAKERFPKEFKDTDFPVLWKKKQYKDYVIIYNNPNTDTKKRYDLRMWAELRFPKQFKEKDFPFLSKRVKYFTYQE